MVFFSKLLYSHSRWLLLKWSTAGLGFDGAETNCRMAHILAFRYPVDIIVVCAVTVASKLSPWFVVRPKTVRYSWLIYKSVTLIRYKVQNIVVIHYFGPHPVYAHESKCRQWRHQTSAPRYLGCCAVIHVHCPMLCVVLALPRSRQILFCLMIKGVEIRIVPGLWSG